MPTVNQQIESSIQSFVSEISGLFRIAALDAVAAALGGAAPARRGRPAGSGRKPGRPAKIVMPARAGRGEPRARRSSADVEATAQKMLTYVKAHDGMPLDEIAKALGTDTASLTRPL